MWQPKGESMHDLLEEQQRGYHEWGEESKGKSSGELDQSDNGGS